MSAETSLVRDALKQQPVCYVEVMGGEKDGLHFKIGAEGLLVGRSATCDVIFDDREVSRRHAYFYTDDRQCYVEDLGSKNGVWINGTRSKKDLLVDGDTVDTGPVRFAFRIADSKAFRSSWLAGGRAGESSVDLPWHSEGAAGSPFRHTLAVSSLAFGVLAYLHWAFGIGAVVLALLALLEMRREGQTGGYALALGGLAVGIVAAAMNTWFAELAPRLREGDSNQPAPAVHVGRPGDKAAPAPRKPSSAEAARPRPS